MLAIKNHTGNKIYRKYWFNLFIKYQSL